MRGCECRESTLDGHWTVQASQNNGHYVTVTPHPECVLRVTILDETTSGEHKVCRLPHMPRDAADTRDRNKYGPCIKPQSIVATGLQISSILDHPAQLHATLPAG